MYKKLIGVSAASFIFKAVFALAFVSMYASAEDKIDIVTQNFDPKLIRSLEISTEDGPISVKGGNVDTIMVETLQYKGEQGYTTVREENGELEIFVKAPVKRSLFGKQKKAKTGISVLLPTRFKIEVESDGGAITVTGIDNEVDADTKTGDIIISNINGKVSVETGTGEVTVSDISKETEIETGRGNITVKAVKDDLSVKSGSGNINVNSVGGSLKIEGGTGMVNIADIAGSRVKVVSGTGDINGKWADAPKAREMEFSSGTGDIKLVMPSHTIIKKIDTGGIRSEEVDFQPVSKGELELKATSGTGKIRILNQDR